MIKYLIALTFTLGATELAPWYGRSLELEPRATALYQYFRSIATPIKPTRYHSFGQFYILSGATSFDRMAAEMEFTYATTPARSFGFDNWRLTGRYILADDVIGDPLSITAGGTLTMADRKAVRDLSSFHHGSYEIEGHVAIGRECSCRSIWLSRWWSLFALGIANKGCPWMRANLSLEKNFCDCHTVEIFVHTLWGCGNCNINLKRQFQGYGLIHHRSVDIGLKANTLFGCSGGYLTFEIAQRVYAWNFPKNATIGFLRATYPFGI